MRQRGPSRHCSPLHIQPTRAALCYIIYVTDDDRFPPCDTLTDILRLIGSLCSSRDVDPNCRGYVRSLATFSSYVYYWLFKYPRVHHSSQLRFDNYRVVNHESLDAIIKIDKIDVGWNLTEGGDLEAAPSHSTGERDGIYRLNFTGSKNFAKPRNFSSEVYKNALVQWSRWESASLKVWMEVEREIAVLFLTSSPHHGGTEPRTNTVISIRKSERDPWKIGCRWSVYLSMGVQWLLGREEWGAGSGFWFREFSLLN